MEIKDKLPFLIIAFFIWVVIISSCANIGSPSGGPRDSIPPVLISTNPEMKGLNFNGNEVRLTFDEFVVPDEVSEELVVSPPLSKKPTIRTKTKSILIQFNEELQDSVTYSLDFKNSIADLNEKNPYKNFRFSFSTGNIYDSLRIAGRVINSFNLNPEEDNLVMLYKNLHDSVVFKQKPNYIGKTDKEGYFMIDNIAPASYRLYSIKDNNSNLLYDEGAEPIAWYDSIVVPSFVIEEKTDSLVRGVDSMLVSGRTRFLPEPVFLRTFTEKIYDQSISTTLRQLRNQIVVAFYEPVKDTFNIKLLNNKAENWYIMENNAEYDSLIFWITDSLVYKSDTIMAEVSYYQLDSLKKLFVKKDTLDFNFTDKEEPAKRRRRGKEEQDTVKKVIQFQWDSSLNSSEFDLNDQIYITSPEPVKSFDSTQVHLFLGNDSLKKPLRFKFEKDTLEWRRYKISYTWKPETEYTIEIDSTASTNVYGITSKKFERKFKTRAKDYYGSIILKISNMKHPMIFQLIKNNDQEELIEEKLLTKEGNVTFDFLPPEKYKVKVIYDKNGNGIWDAGSFQDKTQPERVSYINEVVKIRSNWDRDLELNLNPDERYYKSIKDPEVEEQKRKEALEKEKKDRLEQQNPRRQQGTTDQGNLIRGMGNR